VPEFGRLRRKPPTIRSLGCLSAVPQGRRFSCVASLDGPADSFGWGIDGAASVETSGTQFTTTVDRIGEVTIDLIACNGAAEGGATNRALRGQSVTIGPPLPGVTSPGCPASASLGRAVTCTPTGVTNTNAASQWGWSAPGAQIGGDGTPSVTLTFTEGGAQSVSLVICNGRESCSEPVSQSIAVDTPAPVVALRAERSTYRVGESIELCWTVPGPGRVTIVDRLANGVQRTYPQGDNAGSGCISGTVEPPAGQECFRLEYSGTAGSGSTQLCITVEAAPAPRVTPSPSPSSTSPSGPVLPAQNCTNWAGTWQHGARGLPNLVLTLSGSTLSGSFGGFGQVSGTVNGNTFSGAATATNGRREALEFRLGWSTTGGGSLAQFTGCSYLAVKVGNGGWTDFQR